MERRSPVDYARLSAQLEALHYPLRLALLDQLRFPKLLGDIRVQPHRAQGGNPDRAAARETVREHLNKLVEVGLVRVETVESEGRQVNRYEVNASKLYEVLEEMRRLSTLYAGRGAEPDVTGTLSGEVDAVETVGPRLVLVHGVYEGKAFPLQAATAQDGRWLIGRRRGLPVCLDYDPYVSLENAAITAAGTGFAVADLPESKNGTSVNWRLLAKGGVRPLRAGDVVGVGRSLLSFVPE